MGNLVFGNIEDSYKILIESKDILPDSVCHGMIHDPKLTDELLSMVQRSACNFHLYNQTSIGNMLAIKRAFGNHEEIQKATDLCLKGWLKYMYLKQDPQFRNSNEICESLCVLHGKKI